MFSVESNPPYILYLFHVFGLIKFGTFNSMLKRSSLLSSLLFAFIATNAQFDTAFAKKNIRICADSMAYAFKTKNWDLYSRYVNPAVIGQLNGKEGLKQFMEENFADLPAFAWKQYGPGKILQIVKSEGDLQTVVELKSILEWEGQKITTVSHLIGQSWDGGLFWTFFDSEGDRESAKLIKPDLSNALRIPRKIESAEPMKTKAKKN
jgi:hypothetical protein